MSQLDPGPRYSAVQCALVDNQWTNANFQADSPVGLSYPINPTCPPINASAEQHPASCTIGSSPRYAVNATSAQDVAAAVRFAKENKVRLIIKDTGHDILGTYTNEQRDHLDHMVVTYNLALIELPLLPIRILVSDS